MLWCSCFIHKLLLRAYGWGHDCCKNVCEGINRGLPLNIRTAFLRVFRSYDKLQSSLVDAEDGGKGSSAETHATRKSFHQCPGLSLAVKGATSLWSQWLDDQVERFVTSECFLYLYFGNGSNSETEIWNGMPNKNQGFKGKKLDPYPHQRGNIDKTCAMCLDVRSQCSVARVWDVVPGRCFMTDVFEGIGRVNSSTGRFAKRGFDWMSLLHYRSTVDAPYNISWPACHTL